MIPGAMVVPVLMAGACLGSASVTCAMRTAAGLPFVSDRSRCDGCGAPLGYQETIPVVSFLWRRGTCGACQAPIAPLHLVGELVGAALAMQVCLGGLSPVNLLEVALGLTLLTSASVDALSMRLPDALTVLSAVLCAALAACEGGGAPLEGAGAAIVAGLVLLILRHVYRVRRGDPSFGLGDVKLIAAMALWLGSATPLWIGAACGVALLDRRVLRPGGVAERFPFGPYLAATAWVVGVAQHAFGRLA